MPVMVHLAHHLPPPPCFPLVNQDIRKQVRSSQSRYMKIDKPATCKLNERMYRLTSEPEGEIKPEVMLFAQVERLFTVPVSSCGFTT